jgi:penicillin-binding protein 1B
VGGGVGVTGSEQERGYTRIALAPGSGHTYSTRRLRIVLLLLALVTVPLVLGASTVIYYYLRFSTMVERRLQGERWMVPSRLYARPVSLRPGLLMDREALVKTLNGLKYDHKAELPAAPGEFSIEADAVTLLPRPNADAVGEPVRVVFAKGQIKELIGVTSKRRYEEQTLEPELITYLFDESREKRRRVRYDELPEHLIQAVLAIEDRRFFTHPGLDPFRIIGAALRNLRADSYLQGGSTITQQLVKNFFLTPERTLKRKLQEALLALVLERRAQKQDILELYLNEIYLGQAGSFSINGVGQAARMYFHKDVGNLTLTESALLAGMIQSPNPYNPYRHAKRAKERRDTVLRAMLESGFVDAATAEAALAQPLRVESSSVDQVDAPYFVDLVKAQLQQRYDARDLTTQNLSIQTSLDLRLQAFAQAAVENGVATLEKTYNKRKRSGPIQACLIALEPQTGRVVALVGGRSYGASQYNRVIQAHRQTGSTFKPFVYLAAFEATFDDPALPPLTPATIVDDAPTVFFFEDKEYIPENYEDKYMGPVTLRRALAHSLNVATVKVAEMVGYDTIANLWSKKLGMTAQVQPYPALALGSFEATPFEMAEAYTVLATGGFKVPPVTVMSVVDDRGRTLEEHGPRQPRRVVRPESVYLVVNMMRSVLNNGTAAAARAWGFRPDAAGKTGTTNDLRDAWFAGFTPELLCVVWVGLDDNTPLNLSGAKAALPIWVEFMKNALAGVRTRPFAAPASDVIFVDVDAETGLLATPHCPKVIAESFVVGTEPREPCTAH